MLKYHLASQACYYERSLAVSYTLLRIVLPEKASLPFLRYFDIIFFKRTTTKLVNHFIGKLVKLVYVCNVYCYKVFGTW